MKESSKGQPCATAIVSDERRLAKGVRQVSPDAALQHHPFFYVPAYDDAMQWLFFVSHVPGRPRIFAEHRPDGEILQLTRRDDLNEWSLHPSHDGRYVYFTAGSSACRINMETMQEEVLANFGDAPMVAGGMVGDAMGTTALSRDDRWWAIPVREQAGSRLYILDTQSVVVDCILEAPTIFHPEFHPDDASLLRYCGRYDARMWVVNRDGSNNRLVYQRDAGRKEWVVHETWIPGRRELLAVDWPHGLFRVAIDSGERTEISSLNAWHPVTDRTGRRIVTDTRNPDRGICLLDLHATSDAYEVVCEAAASNRGDHWDAGHCPYDEGPVSVYAPQHTHPHPTFSPDGKYVVFTTDASGQATVMEAELDEAFLPARP
jgi:oligogalacturonide lyase